MARAERKNMPVFKFAKSGGKATTTWMSNSEWTAYKKSLKMNKKEEVTQVVESNDLIANYDAKKDREIANEIIKLLYKECETKNGYLGADVDDLEVDLYDNTTLTSNVFDKIANEIVTLQGQPWEYIRDGWDEDDDRPFRNQRNVDQHIARLIKFTKKYAPKYLSSEDAERFIKEFD